MDRAGADLDTVVDLLRTAGRLALRDALRACAMVLLEPVAEVTATVPDDAVGGVLGDLAARRGRPSSPASWRGSPRCPAGAARKARAMWPS